MRRGICVLLLVVIISFSSSAYAIEPIFSLDRSASFTFDADNMVFTCPDGTQYTDASMQINEFSAERSGIQETTGRIDFQDKTKTIIFTIADGLTDGKNFKFTGIIYVDFNDPCLDETHPISFHVFGQCNNLGIDSEEALIFVEDSDREHTLEFIPNVSIMNSACTLPIVDLQPPGFEFVICTAPEVLDKATNTCYDPTVTPVAGITNAEIQNGDLVLTFSNDTAIDVGNVVGPQGLQGLKGDTGSRGPTGLTGTAGEDGRGITSIAYQDNSIVPHGLLIGMTDGVFEVVSLPEFPEGPQGLAGINGTDGAQGPQGIQGEVGSIGPQGEQGVGIESIGNVGGLTNDEAIITLTNGNIEIIKLPAGPQGIQGTGISSASISDSGILVFDYTNGNSQIVGNVTGDAGPMGPQGIAGIDGQDGAVGPIGPQGPESPHIDYASISQDGNLWLNLSNGTALSAGNVTGPKGETGMQGPEGPKGAQGIQGPIGLTGSQGPQGIQGVGLELAFVSEEGNLIMRYTNSTVDVLGNVKGQQGSVGPQGVGVLDAYLTNDNLTIELTDFSTLTAGKVVGPQGLKGDAGPQGERGLTGPAGATGATGSAGTRGPAGPQGLVGPIGLQGPQGTDGDGFPGRVGPDGCHIDETYVLAKEFTDIRRYAVGHCEPSQFVIAGYDTRDRSNLAWFFETRQTPPATAGAIGDGFHSFERIGIYVMNNQNYDVELASVNVYDRPYSYVNIESGIIPEYTERFGDFPSGAYLIMVNNTHSVDREKPILRAGENAMLMINLFNPTNTDRTFPISIFTTQGDNPTETARWNEYKPNTEYPWYEGCELPPRDLETFWLC